MTTELLDRIDEKAVTGDGSHDKFTHIVVEGWWPKDSEGERTGEFIPDTPVIDGAVYGTPVRALCGKVWIPGDDVRKFQTCPTCLEVAKEQGWTIPNS